MLKMLAFSMRRVLDTRIGYDLSHGKGRSHKHQLILGWAEHKINNIAFTRATQHSSDTVSKNSRVNACRAEMALKRRLFRTILLWHHVQNIKKACAYAYAMPTTIGYAKSVDNRSSRTLYRLRLTVRTTRSLSFTVGRKSPCPLRA